MNKKNFCYVCPQTYSHVLDFDRRIAIYLRSKHTYDYKKEIPKNAPFIMRVQFAADSGDVLYYTRIK